MASDTLVEPRELLTTRTIDMHRAIVSLIDGLEAIDWYQQRAEACSDKALRELLLQSKNEEIEHAMMTLEWIRRHDPVFDTSARTYLFSDRPVIEVEGGEKNHRAEQAGVPTQQTSRFGRLGHREPDGPGA